MRPRPIFVLALGALLAGCATTMPVTVQITPAASAAKSPSSALASPSATRYAKPAGTSDPSAARDVPAYRGDSSRQGAMPGPGPVAAPVVRWSFQATAPIGSQPVVAGGRVILVVSDGTVVALDLATGATMWTSYLGVDAHASPAVVGSILMICADDGAHALDLSSGKPLWAQLKPGVIRGAPAAVGGLVVFASTSGAAFGLEPATGKIRWTTPLGGPNDTSVAATSGTIVVGTTDGAAVALDASTGALKWRTTVDAGARIGTPAISGGRVLLATLNEGGPNTRHITALDLATGSVEWRFASPGDRPSYTPAVADGLAITEGEAGVITALDVATGAVTWQASEPGTLEIVPTLVGGTMYGASNGTAAFALDAATGHELWHLPIKGVPYAPAITGGLELLPTSTGLLYAIAGEVP